MFTTVLYARFPCMCDLVTLSQGTYFPLHHTYAPHGPDHAKWLLAVAVVCLANRSACLITVFTKPASQLVVVVAFGRTTRRNGGFLFIYKFTPCWTWKEICPGSVGSVEKISFECAREVTLNVGRNLTQSDSNRHCGVLWDYCSGESFGALVENRTRTRSLVG